MLLASTCLLALVASQPGGKGDAQRGPQAPAPVTPSPTISDSSATASPTTVQTCLSSPPELEWTQQSNGVYTAETTFGAATKNIGGVTFTTRLFDGLLPSKTWRMVPGETYTVTLRNTLGEEAQGELNTIRDVNWTNLHTHGLHISGESPADDVFSVAAPGESLNFTYRLPCDHSGGTLWYHPHHHGSTAIQVGGGAVGAILVEPNEFESESFPAWYLALTDDELVLVIQDLDFGKVSEIGNGVDALFKTDSDEMFTVINGEYQPTLCLEAGAWRKWRIVHANLDVTTTTYSLDADSDTCSLYLLSKDGVLVHGANNEAPRHIESNEIFLTMASRADVAIACSVPGSYALRKDDGDVIATVRVTGSETPMSALSTFHPLRPSYLQSLLFYDGAVNTESVEFRGRNVNGQEFTGHDDYLFEITSGDVQEWTIGGVLGGNGDATHPFHVHVNHFQLMDCEENHPTGWSNAGDWLDVMAHEGTVRFHTDTFGGHVVIHCHRLEHEDEGLMGVVYINGGCDANYADMGGANDPGCDYDETCASASFSDYDWAAEAEGFDDTCASTSSAWPAIDVISLEFDSRLLWAVLVAATALVLMVLCQRTTCCGKRTYAKLEMEGDSEEFSATEAEEVLVVRE